ncbi:nuclear protein MDM1 isoform X2 [Narcine bancroftii]|uniref:nuclear protein MDM1 isoform X2 n=1 Tax=Narcine bancroftii TaxID=1343680 RepID=UPI0038321F34
MSLRFKGLSEYKRNFRWKDSKRSRSSSPVSKQKIPWAGLPSHLLGNTKEPNFISKKRVPYYRPQVLQSFHWGASRDSISTSKPKPNLSEQEKLPSSEFNERVKEKSQESHKESQKECKTPDGSQKSKVARSQSADCHLHSVQEQAVSNDKQLARNAQKTQDNNIPCRKEVADKAVGNDAVHTKCRNIPPLQKGKVISETEYSSRFKGLQPPRGPHLRKDFEEKGLVTELGSHSLKSTGSITKGQTQKTELLDKQLLKDQNPQKTVYPNKGFRNVKSEYKTSFRSPAWYEYVKTECRSEEGTGTNCISPWYAEVKELREKAEAYKRRVLGTHFSQDHLIQILSEHNKLWDVSSTSDIEESVSDCVKALDLASISSMQQKHGSTEQVATSSPKATTKYYKTVENGLSDVPTLPVSRKLAWNDDREKPCEAEVAEDDQDQNCEAKEVVEGNEEVEAVVEREIDEQDGTGKSNSNGQTELGSDECGRLPTPKLKSTDGAQRTHHDLTTPAIGGAVSVAPHQVKSPSPLRRRTRPPLGKVYSPDKYFSESPSKILRKTELLQQSPAAGVKTYDPIPLREECMPADYNSPYFVKSAPSIQTSLKLHPAFDQNSALVTTSPSKSFPHRIQGALRHPEFQHNGNTGGSRTGQLRLQLTHPTVADNEDDRLSQLSAQSGASSSLASQVFERAQKRRDDFWGKSP